ncbi:hypothetical protein VTO42DRAFT_7408 [Malbranchea cinnamomea]
MLGLDGASASKEAGSKSKSKPSRDEHVTCSRNPYYANVVYYPNWRANPRQPPSSLMLSFVSHVIYAFAWVKADGTVYLSNEAVDEEMPIDETCGWIRAFTQLKPRYPGIKLLLAIGGGGEQGSGNFAKVANDSTSVQRFVHTAKELVDRFELDGLDVDWEHPSNAEEGEDYLNLLAKLRKALPSPRYVLTTALAGGEWALRHIDLPKAQQHLDFINLMAYDFFGHWTSHSGHHSQLFTPTQLHSTGATVSCHSVVMYMLTRGVPSRKILMGIPVYGRAFPGTTGAGQVPEPNLLKVQDPAVAGDAGESRPKDIEFDYADLPRPGATERYDESVGAAFCIDDRLGGAGFVTYDNPSSVKQKAKFARAMNLGGLFYWHIASDAKGERSLVFAGYKALHDL